MFAPVPVDLPAGRQRRGRLEIDGPARLRPVRPGRPAAPGRRQALHRGQEPGQSRSNGRACRNSSCWRSSRTTAKCSGRPRSARFARASRYYFYYMPRHVAPAAAGLSRGRDLLDTHVGVLARLDADSGALDWGYGYKTDPVPVRILASSTTTSPRSRRPSAASRSRPARRSWSRGCSPSRLYAIEPNRMKVLWERPITKASRLLGVDDSAVYLGGAELERGRSRRRGSSCGRRACPTAAWTGACWCGRTACGN